MENYINAVKSIVPSCAKGAVILDKPLSKTINPDICWGFTLNNYTDSDICSISAKIKAYCRFGIFAKEVGEKGTPHLQGYFELRKKARPSGIFGIKRIHFDHKNRGRACNVRYCEKDNDVVMRHPQPYLENIDIFYKWELDIIQILKYPAHPRRLHWIWENIGNAGKTTFAKYIYTHYKNCVVMSGKATDMKNGIVTYQSTNKCLPEIIIIDIPRSTNIEYLSIPGIEEIKNMFFFSGKYEGGMICGKPPHVIVFANVPPIKRSLSIDRWWIRKIEDNGLINEEQIIDNYVSKLVF